MKRIHFLKAVWSDIILLEQDNSYALIDTGYENQKEEIITYLKERSIKSLDFIFITHFHRDHYGSLETLLDTIPIQTVYIKPYSGLDGKTATGQLSDENYRQTEMNYYQKLCQKIKEKSNLVEITKTSKTISWNQIELHLYNTENKLKTIFDDMTHPYYQQYKISENFNSCGILLTYQNKKIYLASDLTDYKTEEKDLVCCNYEIAKQIQSVDVYKSAHHGLDNCNTDNTLKQLLPMITVTTNTKDYIMNTSTYLSRIKQFRKNAKIYSTEDETIIVNLDTLQITAYKN